MDNIRLISESFEQAAYSHAQAMENFQLQGMDRFEDSVRQFSQSVDKLQAILGMQAENEYRKDTEKSVAYDEQSFQSIG